MRTLFRSRRSALPTGITLIAISVLSCTRPERPGEPPIPAREGHANYVRGPIGTTLTKDVRTYTPDGFRALVTGEWQTGQDSAGLQIDLAPGGDTFDPVDAGEFGTVIARISNLTMAADARFHVPPQDTVYWLVFPWHGTEPDPDSVLQPPVARLWVVDVGETVQVVSDTGTYRACIHHYRDTPRQALPARFGGCDHDDGDAPRTDPRYRTGQSRGPAAADAHMTLGHEGGSGNVHCASGCCTGKS